VSIVESLKKIVDPVQARNREEELRAERQQPKRDHDGDPPHYKCRVCGHEDVEPSYCPSCLADTMQRIPGPRHG
jgi:rubrerythrin